MKSNQDVTGLKTLNKKMAATRISVLLVAAHSWGTKGELLANLVQ